MTLTVTDDEGDVDVDNTSVTIDVVPPPPACDYTGTVSGSNRDDYIVIGNQSGGTAISGDLSWDNSSANLDLYLQYQNNRGRWKNAATSTNGTAGVAESISYTVGGQAAGQPFRWRVRRRSGTATYCLSN